MILVIGVTVLVVHTRVEVLLLQGLEARAYSIARSIGAVSTPSLLAYNYAALQMAAEGAVEDDDLVYVVLHDKEGETAGAAQSVRLGSALPSLSVPMEQPISRRVVLADEDGFDLHVLEVVVPVRVEGVEAPWGMVRLGLGHQRQIAALRRVDLGLAGMGLVLAVLAVGVARIMARQITAPLKEFSKGTEALSRGDMSHRMRVSGARELADLAHSYNRMADQIHEKAEESAAYQEQLARLNVTLEEKVRQRTKALEESAVQYRTLVEHSPDSIIIVQRGRVRFVNSAFVTTFGISEPVALSAGFRLESLFDEDSVEVVQRLVAGWEHGKPSSPAEVRARDAAGEPREIELRGSQIEFLGRAAAECLLVDMTEAKRLRAELEDSERLRALGELASGVAHDFNNLLGAVLGRAQLLRNEGFEARVDRDLAVIEKAAQDGRETVRRIQEFSRTRVDRPHTPIDLYEILRDAVDITRPRWKNDAERRNVSVRIMLECGDEPAPRVLGNATELREVFTNLILNAVDAMPQGGSVHIRAAARTGCMRIEVRDSGVGMTEEIRRKLFDPFFTTKGASGTGLGLSMAYGIVARHNGTIDVDSAMGRGTKFVLEFPLCDEIPVPVGGDGAETPELVRPGRILVIDDEPPIAQLIDDALSTQGHSVEIAIRGADGVKMAEVSQYDLVLSDLGMPDMSGWEVAERIRSLATDTPVVLVTGWGTTISEEEIERAGVAAVVHKPFEIKDLLATTSRILSGTRTTS